MATSIANIRALVSGQSAFSKPPARETFLDFMERLVEIAALAHLQTTLRKMGADQKCSLRFFPDGPVLRPTGIGMLPGHSNDRLTNVLRILADIGDFHRDGGRFVPNDGCAK